MKKLMMSFATAALLLIMIPSQANDAVRPASKKSIETEKTQSAEVTALVNRVDEIKAMDKSSMTSSEKKELRKEMRDVKNQANAQSGGVVYISGGVLLLIIIIIILI
jgi:hypothetical protein